jgi:hypothetical protein
MSQERHFVLWDPHVRPRRISLVCIPETPTTSKPSYSFTAVSGVWLVFARGPHQEISPQAPD